MSKSSEDPSTPLDMWIGDGSGFFWDWDDAANWSLGRPPTGGDKVEIETARPIEVDYDRAGNIVLSGLTISGGVSIAADGHADDIIHILGPLILDSPQDFGRIGLGVDARGAIDIETGILSLSGIHNTFWSFVTGPGILETSGDDLIENGARLAIPYWTFTGTVTLAENFGYAGQLSAGGNEATLDLEGHIMTLTGVVDIYNLYLLGPGNLHIVGSGSIGELYSNVGAALVVSGSVTQTGEVDLGRLDIAAGGTWNMDGDDIGDYQVPGVDVYIGGTPLNPGVLDGGGSIHGNVFNNALNLPGRLAGMVGGFTVTGGVYGEGSINLVGNYDRIDFGGRVDSRQELYFGGYSDSVDVADLTVFHPRISGFDKNGLDDVINILGQRWRILKTETSATETTLTFGGSEGAGAYAALTFVGDYREGQFTATSDFYETQIKYA